MSTNSSSEANEPSASKPSASKPSTSKPSTSKPLRTAMAVMRDFLVADDRGATAIEYAMIASGVAGAIITVVYGLGSEVKTSLWDKIAASLP